MTAAAGEGDEFGSSRQLCGGLFFDIEEELEWWFVHTSGDHTFTSLDTLLKRRGTKKKCVGPGRIHTPA